MHHTQKKSNLNNEHKIIEFKKLHNIMCDVLLLLCVCFFWGGGGRGYYIFIFGSGVGHPYSSIPCHEGLPFLDLIAVIPQAHPLLKLNAPLN